MAKKVNPKAPAEVFVEIDEDGNPILVNSDPGEADDECEENNRLARYKFDCFITVETRVVAVDAK